MIVRTRMIFIWFAGRVEPLDMKSKSVLVALVIAVSSAK